MRQCAAGHATEGPVYLHSKCHTSVPTWAKLLPEEDVLVVECAKCKKEVGRFKVNLAESLPKVT